MATTLNNSGVVFPDATTQTTAFTSSSGVTSLNGQTGAITNTTFDAIGSVGYFCYYSASVLAAGGTVAGSSLYYVSTVVANVTDQNGLVTNGSIGSGTNTVYNGSYATRSRPNTGASQAPPLGMTTLSGTWRAMNVVSRSAASMDGCGTASNIYSASVFMRVS
jgi:hypothetical protein